MERHTIAITMDTDWADEAVVEWALALFVDKGIPVTVFTTGRYTCLDTPHERVEVGLHPNLVGRDCFESAFEEVRKHYPDATGFRTHGLHESSNMLAWARQQGFGYDSNVLMWKQPGIVPFHHPSGLMRIPMFWEDDDHFAYEESWETAALDIESPGLKVFDFHPIHLRLNTAEASQYSRAREDNFSPEAIGRATSHDNDRGVRAMALNLINLIREQGWTTSLLGEIHEFESTASGV